MAVYHCIMLAACRLPDFLRASPALNRSATALAQRSWVGPKGAKRWWWHKRGLAWQQLLHC